MAGGYLGKISAVVSANTGDYVRKLSDSASKTAEFAKTVQSDMRAASREATRALDGILTPLQRFERGIQNAASQKLRFRGFDGAIRTVEDLRKRIAGLERQTDIDVAVRASGLKNITELKRALQGLKQEEIDLAQNVGLGGLQNRRNRAAATANSFVATVSVKEQSAAEVEKLDRLIKTVQSLPPERILKISAAVETRQLDAAILKERQLFSLAEEIAKPLGGAAAAFGRLGLSVQAQFIPALGEAQNSVKRLQDFIEGGGNAGQTAFARVAEQVNRTTAAVKRLSEAQSIVGKIADGTGLRNAAPAQFDALNRAAASSQRSQALSGADAQRLGLGAVDGRVAREAAKVEELLARRESQQQQLQNARSRGDTQAEAAAQAAIQKTNSFLEKKTAELLRQVGIQERLISGAERERAARAKLASLTDETRLTITGRAQSLDQADARRSSLLGEVGGLNRSQRQNFSQLFNDADIARSKGKLEEYMDVLDKISFELAKTKRFNADYDKAQRDAQKLKETVDALREQSAFTITGQFQNVEQARASVSELVSSLGKLNAGQAGNLASSLDAAFEALRTGDIGKIQAAFNTLKAAFDKEYAIKVESDDAIKKVRSVREEMSRIADSIGEPSDPLARLAKAAEEARRSVSKLKGEARAAGERDIADLQGRIRLNAASEDGGASGADALANRARRITKAAETLSAPAAKEQKDPFGPAFGSAQRAAENLRGTIQSVQGQIESLPVPLQTQFIPAINRVRDLFARLGDSPTDEELQRASAAAKQLEGDIKRVSVASNAFGGTFDEAFQSSNIKSYSAQLKVLRDILIANGISSGDAAEKVDELAEALRRVASTKGGFANPAAMAGLNEQVDATVSAVVGATGRRGGEKKLREDLKRAGDIGRAGFDKFSLAAQQAGFAIDDFLSSTGGFDQKLRAVSNNVTQLAFILGGTQGLFIGLGAVIAGQAAAALLKWINNTQDAEAQTKAFNDALARQKSLIEELTQAFASLGDSISRKVFSKGAQEASQFRRELEEISKKQRELREQNIAGTDPTVQRERAFQARAQANLEAATDPGQRVAFAREIQQSQARERQAANDAVNAAFRFAGSPAAADVVNRTIQGTFRVPIDQEGEERRRIRDRYASDVAAAGSDPAALARIVERRLNERQSGAMPLGFDTFATPGGLQEYLQQNKDVEALNKLLQSLNIPADAQFDQTLETILEAANGAAIAIEQAQEAVADAIREGVPAARELESQINLVGDELSAAFTELSDARKIVAQTPEDRRRRDSLVSRAQSRVNEATGQRDNLLQRANRFGFERAVVPQLGAAALTQRARENLAASGLENGAIARRLRELDNQRSLINQQARLATTPADASAFAKQEQAINAEVKAIYEATTALRAFTDALTRSSQNVQQNLQSAQARADETRVRDAAFSTPQSRSEAALADEAFRRQQEAARQSQAAIEKQRADLEQLQAGPEFSRIAEINSQLDSGASVIGADRERLLAERERLAREVAAPTPEPPPIDPEVARRAELARRENALDAQAKAAAQRFGLGSFATYPELAERIRSTGAADAESIADRIAAIPDELNRLRTERVGREAWERMTGAELWRSSDADRAAFDAAENARAAQLLERAAAETANRDRIARIDSQLEGSLTPEDRQRLIDERTKLEAQVAPQVERIRRDAARAALPSDLEEQRRQSAIRGAELSMRPGQAEAEAAARGLADIGQYFNDTIEAMANGATREEVGFAFGDEAQAAQQRAMNRFASDSARGAAPAIFSMADEVANAVLQGPSRAALQATDVSTVEGQQELNRLLRGDDASKNQNLVELEKQSQKLNEMVVTLKEVAEKMGVTLDIK